MLYIHPNIYPFHMDSDISQCQLSQKIKISASIWTFFFFRRKHVEKMAFEFQLFIISSVDWVQIEVLQISVFLFVKLEESSHTLWCDTSTLLLFFISSETQVSSKKWFPFSPLCFFNWRIIALQNFVVFGQISARISHSYTHVPSFLNLPPSCLPVPPSGWSQRPCMCSLSHIASSRRLSISQVRLQVSTLLSPYITPSPPSLLPMSTGHKMILEQIKM